MKVLMLSWEYPPLVEGGLAAHVKGLAEALTEAGHQVHVVTPGNESTEEEISSVKVHRVKLGSFCESQFPINVLQGNFGLVKTASEIIVKEKINLLHAHDWLVSYSAQTLKHLHQLPLVTTIHATEKGRNRGIHDSLQWYIHQTEWGLSYESWHTICCSNYMKSELLEAFNMPEDKITVIPNGIHPDDFNSSSYLEKSQYALNHEKIIFSLGRLVYEKGFQILIDAAPLVLEQHPEAKFVIAGKGYYIDTLKGKVAFLGLKDKFLFAGFISDEERNSLYQLSSIVTFPSLYEPFGIVALEAMASGSPVIVSDTGGLTEVIEDGVDGLKFTPNDPYSLADKINYLLANNNWAMELGVMGAVKARTYYTWDKVALQTEEVYQKVYKEFLESPWGLNRKVIVWSGFKGKEFTAKEPELKEKSTESQVGANLQN